MSLESLIATGTKVWLDGVEPNEIAKNCDWGITGATSNPTIVSKIIGHGHFDGRISELIAQGLTKVVDGNLVKVMSWYDNEWGYANQMLREALSIRQGESR